MRTVQGIKTGLAFSPHLWGAHRYTTGGGMCALRGASFTCMDSYGEWCAKGRRTWGATIPIGAKEPPLPPSELCVQTKAKVRLLSAHKVYPCAPLSYRQNVGAAYG